MRDDRRKTALVVVGVAAAASLAILIFFRFSAEDGAESPLRYSDLLPAPRERAAPSGADRVFPKTIPLVASAAPGDARTDTGDAVDAELPISPEPITPQSAVGAARNFMKELVVQEQLLKYPGAPLPDRRLTEEEAFVRVWTPEYLAALRDLQRIVIRDGVIISASGISPSSIVASDVERLRQLASSTRADWYIPERDRTDVSNDEEAYRALLNILGQFEKNEWITEEQRAGFYRGITEVLPPLIEKEKSRLLQGLSQSEDSPLALLAPSIKRSSFDILDSIADIFRIVKPADAIYMNFGPYCFKNYAPFNPIPGVNLWSGCCNCGLVCGSWGCWYFHDCGPPPGFCNVRLGCLNAACGWAPNALYDQLTGICGCG